MKKKILIIGVGTAGLLTLQKTKIPGLLFG